MGRACPTMPEPTLAPPLLPKYLIRIPEVFGDFAADIVRELGSKTESRLGKEYHLIQPVAPADLRSSRVSKFIQWNLRIEHSWPCVPQKMDGFIEKAAQALFRKFGSRNPQALLIGLLEPSASDPYYKKLASNLRGRTLQLFPPLPVGEAESQEPDGPTLFCLVGKEGLFCGLQTPRNGNGFYPGGTKFISQNSPSAISRAGAKIAEALHYLNLHRPQPVEGSHWLELGASPGGMTAELLSKGYRVTAIDRAPLDKRLDGEKRLQFLQMDVDGFDPGRKTRYDAILSDMNGDAEDSIRLMAQLAKYLKTGGLAVFTLKATGVTSVDEAAELYESVVKKASMAGLELFATTHLTYNRREFTLFFERRPPVS